MAEEQEVDLNQFVYAGSDYLDEEASEKEDFGNELPSEEPEKPAEEPEKPAEEAEEPAEEPEEPEEEPEEASEEPEEPEETPKPSGQDEPRIPKSRFDQVNERRKAAERRLAEMEAQRKAQEGGEAPKFDFEGKEKEYMAAVLNEDTDKALSIRNEIRQAEQQHYAAQLRQTQQQATQQTQAEIALKTTISESQARFPQFDGSSEQYDETLTTEALELFEGYKVQGYEPATAMRKAVDITARAYGLNQPAQEEAEAPKPKPKRKPKAPSPRDVEKKERAAAAQPPTPVAQQDEPETGPDPMRMTEAEFDKLDPAEEARLRGDYL